MTFSRRQASEALATLALVPLHAARAQGWPPGVTRIVVPFPPGGSPGRRHR